ncbi:MAG: DNA damage-inducible protein D [Clostridia bacterium]
MENELIKNNLNFENIKHIDDNENEFWYARELMLSLEYTKWGNFKNVIEKAKISCETSNVELSEHFADVGKLSKRANNADIDIGDIKLTRYACYLIAQNGSPTKKTISLAQTYFAIQTRKQELTEQEYNNLPEDERRLYTRQNVKDKNNYLFDTAKTAGVKNFGKFNNSGYKGLYNGETAKDISMRKGISKKEDILDYMGSEELGANLFRITQTDAILKKNDINTENEACTIHHKVGQAVRNTISKLGGTMPEELPTPDKGIKQIEKENKKLLK